MKNSPLVSQPTNSNSVIAEKILHYIIKDDILSLHKFLLKMEEGTEFEIKPLFITFTLYKKNSQYFEIHTTVNDWMMTTSSIKLTTLFLFGKVDSTFFTWI